MMTRNIEDMLNQGMSVIEIPEYKYVGSFTNLLNDYCLFICDIEQYCKYNDLSCIIHKPKPSVAKKYIDDNVRQYFASNPTKKRCYVVG